MQLYNDIDGALGSHQDVGPHHRDMAPTATAAEGTAPGGRATARTAGAVHFGMNASKTM